MKAKPFPMGFWIYGSMDSFKDASCVKDWADIGSTLTMTPIVEEKPEHIKKMKAILDACQERDMKVILWDERAFSSNLEKQGEKKYREGFKRALKDFGKHPALFGFMSVDEPNTKYMDKAYQSARIQKQMAPHLTPFCNMGTWAEGEVETWWGFQSCQHWLDDYITRAKPEFVCYDCYSQLESGERGLKMYFNNLHEHLMASQRHKIPFWTTLCSVSHGRMRLPNEDDFRWQVNTAVAHGARGLMWFFLYMREPHGNYRMPPIDEHYERTQTYEWLSRVNRTFHKTLGCIINDLKLQRVSHVGKAYGGVPLFDGSGITSRAKSLHDLPLIVSEFKHKNGQDYVAVVNNSQTESTEAELWFKTGSKPKLYKVGWLAKEDLLSSQGIPRSAAPGRDYIMTRPWLAPGQLELYRIEDAVQAKKTKKTS